MFLERVLEESLALRNKDADEGHGNFLQLSGLRVWVTNGSISRVCQVSDFGEEKEVNPNDDYSVATTPYVAKGAFKKLGDFFRDAPEVEWDWDVSACVRRALSILDPAVFSLMVSDEQRWQFSGNS